ncbi:SseB family protein [Actinoplanes sp. NPDC005259]|uniref:SseB family protein n=1 Tax=Actinoplanes sp. NPDC005259 TaxID=3154674 RepID=UPI0033AF6683
MTEWEPATDAEVAMRNALRTDDQESYFRILAGVDLLLPVSADALAGLAPLGWGTWSTGGRTHVLAFTSPAALQACLADYTGSARRVAYSELADTWPNLEWWLAVNPGLPIEGYLPAWFVAQLSRGDLRLPTRGPGREGSNAPERIQDLHAAATLAANAAAQGYSAAAAAQAYPAAAQPGGPMTDRPMSGAPAPGASPASTPVSGVRSSGPPALDPAGSPAYSGTPYGPPPSGSASGPPASSSAYGPPPGGAAHGQPSGGSGYGPPPGTSAYGPPPGGAAYGPPPGSSAYGPPPGGSAYGPPPGGSAYGPPPGGSAPAGVGGAAPAGAHPAGRPAPASGSPGLPADPAGGEVGPGGLPLRTPGGVLPSGLPARVPGTPQGPGGGGRGGNGIPGGQFNGFGVPDRAGAAQPTGLAGEPGGPPHRPGGETGGASGDVPAAYAPPTVPPGGATRPPSMPSALDALAGRTGTPSTLGGRPGSPTSTSRGAGSGEPAAPPQRPDSPLPTRTPMAQTPPLPAHIPPPTDDDAQRPPLDAEAPDRPGQDVDATDQDTPDEASPKTAPKSAAAPPRTGLAPPVIPGAAGAGRSTDAGPAVPVVLERRIVPPTAEAALTAGAAPEEDDFIPANEVERDLIQAVDDASTDSFLSTLLLATVLVPVAPNSRPGSAPGESGFAFRTEEIDGERFLVVFTSKDRLAEHFAEPARTVAVRFVDLIRNWPDPAWSFAVNPTSVIGARYPGPQVIALASWAVEAGLGGDPADAPAESAAPSPSPRPTEPSASLTTMQKAVPAEQVDYYLERGYDRVAGFVHRAGEVEHLNSPGELFAALGLIYEGSPYQPDAKEAFVLSWPAHRPSLYRIPYGGQSEQALRAMDGWVIERSPFRGNGFAPGEGKDVIAEFKVDSVRLPHGAELWRMDADGDRQLVAVFDCDAPVWRRVGEQ